MGGGVLDAGSGGPPLMDNNTDINGLTGVDLGSSDAFWTNQVADPSLAALQNDLPLSSYADSALQQLAPQVVHSPKDR